mmetsp:Transcript_5790/g.10102  ORF Transcript_5790/g.10102 Transcript_5790/m.10102 type:complete len:80 (+) Transcript_5790:1383-1622(+)
MLFIAFIPQSSHVRDDCQVTGESDTSDDTNTIQQENRLSGPQVNGGILYRRAWTTGRIRTDRSAQAFIKRAISVAVVSY